MVPLLGKCTDPMIMKMLGKEYICCSCRMQVGIWAFVPALEVSVAWKQIDIYIEAEYVSDSNQRSDSYLYAWSELGYRPAEWLRFGLAAQRTRAYGGERDIQRGPFAQLTWRRVTLGGFWFNPGSKEQVFVASLGVAF